MGAEHLEKRRLGHIRQLGGLRVAEAPLADLIDQPERPEL